MQIDVLQTLSDLYASSGIAQFVANPLALVMVGIACLLMYLAIVKQFEPLLLLPIAFGMLLTNLLGSDIFHEELFAGGHVNWGLFGGALLVDGNNLLDQAAYVVNAAGGLGGIWQMLMGRALVPVANVLPTIVVTSLLSGAIVGGVGSMFSIRKHLNV